MWHSITPVEHGHDPIVYEGSEPSVMVVLNAGPGTIEVRSWDSRTGPRQRPDMKMEVRAGSQRIVRAALVRIALQQGSTFAAVGSQLIGGTVSVSVGTDNSSP